MSTDTTIEGFYHDFSHALRVRIAYLLGERLDAEDVSDVLQEVFIKAYLKWEALADHGHPYGWLYKIATTTSLDMLRRRKARLSPLPLDTEYDYLIDPLQHDPLDVALTREAAREQFATLTEHERAVLMQEAFYGIADRKVCYNVRRAIYQRKCKRAQREKARAWDERL